MDNQTKEQLDKFFKEKVLRRVHSCSSCEFSFGEPMHDCYHEIRCTHKPDPKKYPLLQDLYGSYIAKYDYICNFYKEKK